MISLLEKTPPTGHDEVLYNALQLVPGSECLYIIDRDGRQTSETVCTDHCFNHPETQRLFHPARKGTDHSFKEYSYITSRSASGRFTSDRYISLATGSLCRTEAWSFAGGELILCIDITDSIQT